MLMVTDAAGRDAGTELLTSNQAKKQYGPVDWSESVLERVHCVTENNDEEAAPDVWSPEPASSEINSARVEAIRELRQKINDGAYNMTPEQHATDLCLRLAAMKPEDEDDIAKLLTFSFKRAIDDERARCADIVQQAREGERDTDFRSIIHAIRKP